MTEPAAPSARNPLDIQRELRNAWDILTLKSHEMDRIATKPDATEVALVFYAFGIACSFLSGLVFPRAHTYIGVDKAAHTIVGRPSIADLVGETVLGALALAAVIWVISHVAGGRATFSRLAVVLGYGALAFALTTVPFLALLAFSWWFAVAFVALRASDISKERALRAVLLGITTLLCISFLALHVLDLSVWLHR